MSPRPPQARSSSNASTSTAIRLESEPMPTAARPPPLAASIALASAQGWLFEATIPSRERNGYSRHELVLAGSGFDHPISEFCNKIGTSRTSRDVRYLADSGAMWTSAVGTRSVLDFV